MGLGTWQCLNSQETGEWVTKIQERGPVHSWAPGQAGFSFPKTKGSASGLQEGAEASGECARPGGVFVGGYQAVPAGLG